MHILNTLGTKNFHFGHFVATILAIARGETEKVCFLGATPKVQTVGLPVAPSSHGPGLNLGQNSQVFCLTSF